MNYLYFKIFERTLNILGEFFHFSVWFVDMMDIEMGLVCTQIDWLRRQDRRTKSTCSIHNFHNFPKLFSEQTSLIVRWSWWVEPKVSCITDDDELISSVFHVLISISDPNNFTLNFTRFVWLHFVQICTLHLPLFLVVGIKVLKIVVEWEEIQLQSRR